MKENAQILLRMMTEFHRQVQDSLGEQGKPALLLGNPVVRTFNVYLEQMREMFPDSFIAQVQAVETVPELGETELAPDELEKLHLSKAHEVSMACSQIIEYLSGMLNGEVGFSKTTRRLPEILAVLDTLRQEIQELQLTNSEENKRVTEILMGKYNDCLLVCYEAVGEDDVILPRLFKPIEFAGDELSYAAKIQEVRISASGLHAYLETLEQQEAALKKQQNASIHEFTVEVSRVRDWMDTKDRHIRSEFENVRQQAEGTKEQVFEKIENVEVQLEERVHQLEERLDEMNENFDELKDRFNDKIDECVNKLDERIDGINEELEEVNQEYREDIEERLGEAHRNIEEFEEKLIHSEDKCSERIDGIDEKLEEVNQRLDETSEKMEQNIDEKVHHLEEQLDERIGERDERFDELNERIDELAENLDEKANELSEEREELKNELEERMEEYREEIDQRIDDLKKKIDK